MTKTQILARAAGAVLVAASVGLLAGTALGYHGAHAAVAVTAGPDIDQLALAPHPTPTTTATTRPPAATTTTTTLPPASTPAPSTPPATVPQWTGTSSSGPDTTTTCPTCTAVHDGTSFNYADPTVTVEYPDGSCGQTGQTEAQTGGYLIIPASQCADGTYTGDWVDGHPPYQGPGQPVSGGPSPATTTTSTTVVAPSTTTTVPATTTTTTQ